MGRNGLKMSYVGTTDLMNKGLRLIKTVFVLVVRVRELEEQT